MLRHHEFYKSSCVGHGKKICLFYFNFIYNTRNSIYGLPETAVTFHCSAIELRKRTESCGNQDERLVTYT